MRFPTSIMDYNYYNSIKTFQFNINDHNFRDFILLNNDYFNKKSLIPHDLYFIHLVFIVFILYCIIGRTHACIFKGKSNYFIVYIYVLL